MRQGQQNRRGRGRNRKSQNPLTRSFESNGPDVKIRGTPAHIAEKYISLARDAHTTGDPVLAESYLQHAEHYNRIIMAFREQQIPDSGLHHALVGHFHSPRHLKWYTYPGNPDPLTFGEEGIRGPVIVDVAEDGQVSRQTHDVSVTRLHDIHISLDGIDHSGQVIAKVQADLAPLDGVVRATLNGEVGEDVDLRLEDLQHVADHLDGFLPRMGAVTTAYDLDELALEQTVRGQFVRDVREDTSLDQEQRRRIIVTGLRALAGRTDLEVQ